jgi:enterochelin esterase family protein
MFDGNACCQDEYSLPVSIILDNLIAQKKIASLVTVFVFHSTERNNELACSEMFADFVARELIPQVRKDYRVTAEPEHTIISGFSLGGLMSAFSAYRHPEVFGNVLSLSGSYPWCPGMFEGKMTFESEPGWLTRQFVASQRLPLNFYLAAGRFENFYPFSLLAENRRLRDVLLAKGYDVQYSEFSGGHDPVCWRGPFVDGLICLIGTGGLNK